MSFFVKHAVRLKKGGSEEGVSGEDASEAVRRRRGGGREATTGADATEWGRQRGHGSLSPPCESAVSLQIWYSDMGNLYLYPFQLVMLLSHYCDIRT